MLVRDRVFLSLLKIPFVFKKAIRVVAWGVGV